MRAKKIALVALGVALAVGGWLLTDSGKAMAQNVACYLSQGGASFTAASGCTINVSAGTLTVGTSATFNLDGTAVTASGAELNLADGQTATAAELNAAADQSGWAALDPGADDSITLAEHGAYPSKAILLSSADGDTFTLPAASGTGAVYTVIVSTTVTSNNHIIQTVNATDEFYGIIYLVDTSDDSVDMFPSLDADGFDTITCNGSTKCGIKGDMFKFTDVAAGQWQVEGNATCTGTCASMLSAAVS